MVKLAIAGGTSNVASNILHTAIHSGKHEVTIFTRGSPPTATKPGIEYKKIDYYDRAALTEALKGFHTCLSFVLAHLDPDGVVQKNLIDACIDAGVKRFAPSEWGIGDSDGVPIYQSKIITKRYLEERNKDQQILEYCLFQPSVFMDYLGHPYVETPANLVTFPLWIDPSTRHALTFEGDDKPMVLTALKDVDAILALALDDPRPWPTSGGIQGARTTPMEILELAKQVRGGEWTVEHVSREELERGEARTKWVPPNDHPSLISDSEEKRDKLNRQWTCMLLNPVLKGAWDVSTEWNERFPEYKFVGLREFVEKIWAGKP